MSNIFKKWWLWLSQLDEDGLLLVMTLLALIIFITFALLSGPPADDSTCVVCAQGNCAVYQCQ